MVQRQAGLLRFEQNVRSLHVFFFFEKLSNIVTYHSYGQREDYTLKTDTELVHFGYFSILSGLTVLNGALICQVTLLVSAIHEKFWSYDLDLTALL